MKILVIGDIHGRDAWKELIPKVNEVDLIIFTGDYTDQYPPMSDDIIKNNLLEIIEFAKSNPGKVKLLLGNHDIQYMFNNYYCSGFRPSMLEELHQIFTSNIHLFSIAYGISTDTNEYLFTHAGVSFIWANYFNVNYDSTATHYSDWINQAFTKAVVEADFKRLDKVMRVGRVRGGSNPAGPVWADRRETYMDCVSGLHQIVGHTPIKEITKIEHSQTTSITYIDVLNEYYEQGKPSDFKFYETLTI